MNLNTVAFALAWLFQTFVLKQVNGAVVEQLGVVVEQVVVCVVQAVVAVFQVVVTLLMLVCD